MANINQCIQDFYRVAQERDFTRDFQFRVVDIQDRGVSVCTQDDLVYAQTAQLPARAINNQTVPYMGLSFNVPGAATYTGSEGYAIQFRADGEHIIRTIFENCQNDTFDDETSTGTYRLYQNSSITLGLLNQDLDVTRTYQLVGVYPVTVGEIGFDTAGTGAPVNFTATLAYQYWRRRSLGTAL